MEKIIAGTAWLAKIDFYLFKTINIFLIDHSGTKLTDSSEFTSSISSTCRKQVYEKNDS